ncbi:MAG TPA: riboflavin biosynthesis protein RibD, partial [Xanthomonadaceae bacterium]|nr:riboflavin biosynthesis protein RibD [Xanthomonadaceae bacterium]
ALQPPTVPPPGAPALCRRAGGGGPPAGLDIVHAAVPLAADGRLDLHAVLGLLAEREINEVHVEAGATLCGALLREGLADELLLYTAPLLLGDGARPLLAGLDIGCMAERIALETLDVRMLGQDLRWRLRPRPGRDDPQT